MVIKNLIFSILVLFILSSCSNTKKLEAEKKAKIEQLQELNKSLQILKEVTIAKGESDKMAKEEVAKTLKAIDKKMEENTATQAAVKKISKPGSEKSLFEGINASILSQQRSIETMRDLYKLETFKEFNASRFFKVGEYTLPQQDIEPIKQDLEPLADAIIDFIKLHPNQKLRAVMGIYGYSDEQAIGAGGTLYKKLAAMIGNDNPSQVELNQKLSELRAQSLASLVKDVIKQKQKLLSDLSMINFEVNWVGRGTELPFKTMVSPKPDDERRRVVTFIWTVNAEEFFNN